MAGFSGSPTSGSAPLTVVFTDLSTGSDITSWAWDFAGAGTSTEQHPSHTFDTEGTYTISLTVSGPAGANTFTRTDYVTVAVTGAEIIVDHGCTDLTAIPSQWIDAAKDDLHIAYGHTSHGSQVTSGMSGLVNFTGGNGGPRFAWNDGGTGGALDLHDYAMGGDAGYYPQWVDNTRAYLNDPNNVDVNVIIWSWCGQVSSYTEQNMIAMYLAPMSQLEVDYPGVRFVYMTGHLNYGSMANTNARNQQIRDFCAANDKVLYDFAHIESFDPDGAYYPFASDSCDYWNAGGIQLGNWAIEWQNTHTQDVDWYSCSSAHSQPLNANQKAYAAWWLWARLAGWDGH